MSYSLSQIKKFARDSIKDIIPLDDDSIDEMITYTISNFKTKEAISNHLLDILGPSDVTFSFITKFCDMLFENEAKRVSNNTSAKPVKAAEAPVPITPAPKKVITTKPKGKVTNSGIKLVKHKTLPVEQNSKGRLANNTRKGATTSEMFDLKPKSVEVQKVKNKEVKKKLESIDDLDQVLLQLELSGNNDTAGDIRVCNCNATRHPLFEMYPNCLNCGKIICQKEGLQPCSFCGKSLMSNEERMEMLHVLDKERQELESEVNAAANPAGGTAGGHKSGKAKKKNVIKITLNTPGQNNFKVQEQFYKQIEASNKQKRELEEAKRQEQELIDQNQKDLDFYKAIHKKDDELLKAEERLAMLLSFQDNGAERTKIIDHASDFELPTGTGSLWASPMERIIQFKRQQKQQQKMHDQQRLRSGRGETVLNMGLQNGQVVFDDATQDSGLYDDLSDDEEIAALQKQANLEKLQQFKTEAKNVYDYKTVNSSFIKPVYKGETVQQADLPRDMVADLPALGKIVQLGDSDQQENRLFTMVGV